MIEGGEGTAAAAAGEGKGQAGEKAGQQAAGRLRQAGVVFN